MTHLSKIKVQTEETIKIPTHTYCLTSSRIVKPNTWVSLKELDKSWARVSYNWYVGGDSFLNTIIRRN